MQGIYEAAEIYHYAFGFRDTHQESKTLIEASDLFGNGGRRFLEIACGNCPYVLDLLKADIDYHGLDLSGSMLAFSAERMKAAGYLPDHRLHLEDMRDFSLPTTFDLAFVLMGSLQCLSNDEFLQHLDQMQRHLNPGGIYILEWCIEYSPSVALDSTWVETSPFGEICVRNRVTQKSVVDQMFEEQIDFELNGELVASSTDSIYFRYPNEFNLLLQLRETEWEIAGSFNNWNLEDPVVGSSNVNRPLCILRRRAK